jgi:DNA (cytosine-5)-methyltransferase 1
MAYNAIDLFSGCGGLSEGLHQAGFKVIAGIEINKYAVMAYAMNHKDTCLFEEDIRSFDVEKIRKLLNGEPLHLLAGCPPCQGFSTIRKLNKKQAVNDERNTLILEYLRFVEELKPLTIMMENVPGLTNYYLFNFVLKRLTDLGYNPEYGVVNVANYGVPQRRKRLVLVGSLLGELNIAPGNNAINTVRKTIGRLESVKITKDPIHKIYPKHKPQIQEMISIIPKDGGSRTDLPKKYWLDCHKKKDVGFRDVYGRLKWDDISSTITGGCLKPSKGRFLHPEEDRCITAREAALLQTFPRQYKFPVNIPTDAIALLIGNALPPEFSRIQAQNIYVHVSENIK